MIYHIKDDKAHKDISKPPGRSMIQPVLFLSRRLSPAETRYWPTELEVAAVVWVIRKIRHLIEACSPEKPCIFYTDHSATTSIAEQSSLTSTSTGRTNLRHIRASQYVQQFRIKMFHRPGKTNVIADALSRLTATDDDKPVSSAEAPELGELGQLLETIRVECDPCRIVTNGLLFSKGPDGPERLCIPHSMIGEIFARV